MREAGCWSRTTCRTLVLIAAIASLAGSGLAGAQDVPGADAGGATAGSATGEELLRLQDQLRRRTESALADRKQQRARLDELEAEARAARRQNDAIARQLEKQKERLASIRSESSAAETRAREIEEREGRLKERIRTFLSALEQRIAGGIPWKIEDRRQAVADAIQMLGDPRTGAAAALATLARLQKEQEAVGRLVETGTLEIETAGGPIAVQGFHLGLLGVVFANDDGTIIGFATAGETLEGGLEAVREVPEAAKGYQRAVDILNRRRTPELTDIHLPELPVEGGGR